MYTIINKNQFITYIKDIFVWIPIATANGKNWKSSNFTNSLSKHY